VGSWQNWFTHVCTFVQIDDTVDLVGTNEVNQIVRRIYVQVFTFDGARRSVENWISRIGAGITPSEVLPP